MALSDIPVFREITENQASYFSPKDVRHLAASLEKLLLSKPEQERQIRYGESRLGAFRFDALAAQVEALYARVLTT
jgi:hypothetical protein